MTTETMIVPLCPHGIPKEVSDTCPWCVDDKGKAAPLPSDQDAAFEQWWEEYRQSSWKRGLLPDETDRPMPSNWSNGNKPWAQLGWMACVSRLSADQMDDIIHEAEAARRCLVIPVGESKPVHPRCEQYPDCPCGGPQPDESETALARIERGKTT